MFSNQFAAFFMTFIILFALYFIIGAPAQILNTNAELFTYLDMGRRFSESLNQGIINLSDIVYFLSVTALGLFIGSAAIESRRWR